jgi:hypothetical protein
MTDAHDLHRFPFGENEASGYSIACKYVPNAYNYAITDGRISLSGVKDEGEIWFSVYIDHTCWLRGHINFSFIRAFGIHLSKLLDYQRRSNCSSFWLSEAFGVQQFNSPSFSTIGGVRTVQASDYLKRSVFNSSTVQASQLSEAFVWQREQEFDLRIQAAAMTNASEYLQHASQKFSTPILAAQA